MQIIIIHGKQEETCIDFKMMHAITETVNLQDILTQSLSPKRCLYSA